MEVSIPHRYGKNDFLSSSMLGQAVVSIPHRYGKNLIGSVLALVFGLFPFLIGTVRTWQKFPGLYRSCSVSIPHRYGKNKDLLDNDSDDDEVSIPHRYGKNLFYTGHLSFLRWFPFLIGTVRTEKSTSTSQDFMQFPFLIGTVRTQGALDLPSL